MTQEDIDDLMIKNMPLWQKKQLSAQGNNKELLDRIIKETVKEEREACILICEKLSEKYWDMYKGRGTAEPNNIGRADLHYQGLSDGADKCEQAIRARGNE